MEMEDEPRLSQANTAIAEGYFALDAARTARPMSRTFRRMALTIWGATALFAALLVALYLRDSSLHPVALGVTLAFLAASIVAWSAERNRKAFGDGIMAMVKPDTLEVLRDLADHYPDTIAVLPLGRRGDSSWAPTAAVSLHEPLRADVPPIEFDFYAPRARRGKPPKPKIGPGGGPVHLAVIRGWRYSFDPRIGEAAQAVMARVVFAVRY